MDKYSFVPLSKKMLQKGTLCLSQAVAFVGAFDMGGGGASKLSGRH